MMFSWILSPLGRWLSVAGATVATLGVAWLKGRAAGKAAWEEKRRAAREKAMQQSTERSGASRSSTSGERYLQGQRDLVPNTEAALRPLSWTHYLV
jgi:hypothetical protein